MIAIVSYWINWETSEGDFKEEEIDVEFKSSDNFTDEQLDETGRRYLISETLEKGGRVIKLRKLNSRKV